MDKIYEIYNTGNSVVMLTTEQHLYDIMMDEHHKGWYYKELSLADTICIYGNMALAAKRSLESQVPW